MGIEIERKFLVQNDLWKTVDPMYFCQGYLNLDRQRTVRVRVADKKSFLSVKGLTTGASRLEFEYEIPGDEARQLLDLCEGPLVEKNRYVVHCHGMHWEIDEFLGENLGLVIAEIELESEDQTFQHPEWLGTEVTHDARYFNSNLSVTPFSQWPKP